MSLIVPKCKITVLKRTIHYDLVDEYLVDEYKDIGPCECFQEGQEFVIDLNTLRMSKDLPPEFCPHAWADIRGDVLAVVCGSDIPADIRPGVGTKFRRHFLFASFFLFNTRGFFVSLFAFLIICFSLGFGFNSFSAITAV